MKKVLLILITLLLFINVDALGLGDVNNDGKITSQDYILVRKHIMKTTTLTADQIKTADMNKDNKINTQDYILIKKKIMDGETTPQPITTPTPAVKYNVTLIGANPIKTGFEGREILIKGGKVSEHRSDKSKLNLSLNTEYVVSFDYRAKSGENKFDIDLYPDTLPQVTLTATTTKQHYDWRLSSASGDMSSCQLRFFDDIRADVEKDVIINNVVFNDVKTITYNGGSALSDLPTPSRTGYKFLGWYTSSTGGNKVTSSTVVTGDMTLYARWAGTYDHVFIIGVDGLGDTFRKDKRSSEPNNKVDAKNFYRIFGEYAYRNDSKSENITISAQNWTSIFTGVACETHGITNDIATKNERNSSTAYPSIFYYIKKDNPYAKLTSIVNWNPINHGIIENDLGVDKTNFSNDNLVTSKVIEYLNNNQSNIPTLMFVHLCDVDHAAHNTQGSCATCGGYSKEYYDYAQAADTMIGQIYDKIESLGLMNNSLFIVVADHGEAKNSHGNAQGPNRDPKEETVVVAVRGYTVNKMTLPTSVHNRDVSAIVLYALGVDIPEQFISSVPNGLFNK